MGPAFDTPLRRRMAVQLRMFIGELERLGVHGELGIDGSFATKKPEPGDIDPGIVRSESYRERDV